MSETPPAENTRDWMNRQRAFEDYDSMTLWNEGKRSVGALWRHYCQENRQGNPVPTTTRAKIFAWFNEDQWDQKIAQRELARNETTRQQYERVRERAYDNVTLLLDRAVEKLGDIIDHGDKDATRLEAIKVVLNMTVGPPKLAERPGDVANTPKQPELPDPDSADDETLRQFLRAKADAITHQ